MTPQQVIEERRSSIERWLAQGSGMAYEFYIDGEDSFGQQVVAELHARGYAAIGKRETVPCSCMKCNGGLRDGLFSIQVRRHPTVMPDRGL